MLTYGEYAVIATVPMILSLTSMCQLNASPSDNSNGHRYIRLFILGYWIAVAHHFSIPELSSLMKSWYSNIQTEDLLPKDLIIDFDRSTLKIVAKDVLSSQTQISQEKQPHPGPSNITGYQPNPVATHTKEFVDETTLVGPNIFMSTGEILRRILLHSKFQSMTLIVTKVNNNVYKYFALFSSESVRSLHFFKAFELDFVPFSEATQQDILLQFSHANQSQHQTPPFDTRSLVSTEFMSPVRNLFGESGTDSHHLETSSVGSAPNNLTDSPSRSVTKGYAGGSRSASKRSQGSRRRSRKSVADTSSSINKDGLISAEEILSQDKKYPALQRELRPKVWRAKFSSEVQRIQSEMEQQSDIEHVLSLLD